MREFARVGVAREGAGADAPATLSTPGHRRDLGHLTGRGGDTVASQANALAPRHPHEEDESRLEALLQLHGRLHREGGRRSHGYQVLAAAFPFNTFLKP